MIPLTPKTHIDNDFRLSRHMRLFDLIGGTSESHYTATIAPEFIDIKNVYERDIVQQYNILYTKYKIVQNLRDLCINIIDPLKDFYGENMQIYTAYISPKSAKNNFFIPESKHLSGEAVDFYVKTSPGNMFVEIETIQDILQGKYDDMGLVFKGQSWVHVSTNGTFTQNPGDLENPTIWTFDAVLEMFFKGFAPMKGLESF